jgi:hypothetical protein
MVVVTVMAVALHLFKRLRENQRGVNHSMLDDAGGLRAATKGTLVCLRCAGDGRSGLWWSGARKSTERTAQGPGPRP